MTHKERQPENSNDRITVRFGDPIMQDGFTSVPNLVLNYYSRLGISQAEMLFIIHVWQFWWTEKNPFPALNTVAIRMNISRRQARNYVQSLKGKEFAGYPDLHLLNVYDRFEPGRGQTSSEYDFSGLFRAIVLISQGQLLTPRKNPSGGGRKILSEAPRKSSSPEEDNEEENEKRINLSNIRMGNRTDVLVDNSGDNSASQPVNPPRTASMPKSQNDTKTQPPIADLFIGEPDIAASLQRLENDAPEAIGTILKWGRGRPPTQNYSEDRQQITAYIQDFAREMGDTAPLKSSVTRADNLYQASSRPIALFIDAMYQARAKTKERTAAIRGKANLATPYAPKAKMAYFFALLEDELGMRESEQLPLDG